MSRISNIDWYRHLSFAAVGGFFAAYAILLRMGIMANAQTLNLLKRQQKSRHKTDQPCLRFFWKVMLVGYVTAESQDVQPRRI